MALPNSQAPEEKKNTPERVESSETRQELYALKLSAKTQERLNSLKRGYNRTKRGVKQEVGEEWRKINRTPEAKKVKGGLASLKESVSEGISKIKDVINDPEARKEALTAIGAIAAIMIFGKNEDIEDREKGEEETTAVIKNMEKNGEAEVYEPPTQPIDVGDGEVADNYRFIAIQLKAAMNKRNTGELKDMGIEMPENAKKLNALSMFRKGIGEYSEFRESIIKNLQPNAPEKNKVKNCVAILSRSALGKYQILPKHHFHHLNNYPGMEGKWSSENPEVRLMVIYKYLRSESMQDYVNMEISRGLKNKYNGIPEAMAAAYYSGPDAGQKVMEIQQKINRGEVTELPEWITKKQEQGGGTFGSIYFYSGKAAEYYRTNSGGKKLVENSNDLIAFQKAIAKKETQYLEGKRAKRKIG